jgi:hypothetical protein
MIKTAAGGTDKGARWRYGDLPAAIQSGISVWIVKNIIDPRYTGTAVTTDIYGPSSTRDPAPERERRDFLNLGLGKGIGSGGGGVPQTLVLPPPATVMGPQSVATDTEQAVAASQAAMSAQAADTVTAAQVEQARVDGGFLSTNTGKAVAVVAAAGAGYFLWQQIQKMRGA